MGHLAGNGKIQLPGRRKISRRGSVGPGPGKSLRSGQSSSGVGVGNALVFSQEKHCGSYCGFEHQRVQFEVCVAEPLQAITAILPGSNWSCLSLCILLQDALSEVTKNYPLLKLRVFVGDITAFMNGINKELGEMAEKVLK